MATARRRRRRRRPRAHSRLERTGTAAAGALRSLLTWLGGALADALAWAWRAFCAQRPALRLALVAAVLAAVWLARGDRAAPTVDTDVEALARVIRSEIGIGSPAEQVHVAWATRNLAAERGQSIRAMACSPCGPQERGRPVSSKQQATDADRALAEAILEAPAILDPTGGATHFINPSLQDELARRGVPGYAGRSYQVVRRIWQRRYRWEPYYRLSDQLELWGARR